MFSTECARLAERHPDLAEAAEKVIAKLREMNTAEAVRGDDLASFLEIDRNQADTVLAELAKTGFLCAEEMIECSECGMLIPRPDYDAAKEEDGECRCTSCDGPLGGRLLRTVTTYRRGEKWTDISGGSKTAELPGDALPAVSSNATLDDQGFYPYGRLAVAFNVDKDALRKRLDRYRNQNLNGGWKQNEDRRPREPKYLYRLKDVKLILNEIRASSERPAK